MDKAEVLASLHIVGLPGPAPPVMTGLTPLVRTFAIVPAGDAFGRLLTAPPQTVRKSPKEAKVSLPYPSMLTTENIIR
jgi:hypothetical protein